MNFKSFRSIISFSVGNFIIFAWPLSTTYKIGNVRAIFFIFIAFLFLLLFLGGFKIVLNNKLFIGYLYFVLWMLIGLAYTRSPNYGLSKLILVTSYFVILNFILYNILMTFDLIYKFALGLLFGAIGLIIISFYEIGNPLKLVIGLQRFFRLESTENSNPILFARYLVLAFIVIVWYQVSSRRLVHLFWVLPSLAIASFYTVSTGSKGPIVSLIMAASLSPLVLFRHRIIIFSTISIIFISLGIYFFRIFPKEFLYERYVGKAVETLSGRSQVYQYTISTIMRSDFVSLFFGHGTGDFAYLMTGKDKMFYPHNVFLEITYENGIIGLLLITSCFFLPVISLLKIRSIASSEEKILICMLFACYIDSVMNAQFTGDLGANFMIGIFGVVIVACAKTVIESKTS